MLSRPARLVIKHHDRRARFQHVAAVGPQIRALGLAAARVQLLHRGFVGMQHAPFQQQARQAIRQRLQRHPDAAHPFGHRGAGQHDLIPRRNSLQPVQRQVVQVFADQDPDIQTHRRHPAIDHGGRDRCRRHRLAGPAGVLRTDVAMHEEAGGFDVQLFADVFANLDEVLAALPAGAGFRFVTVFDAGQMIRQHLTTGTGSRGAGSLRCRPTPRPVSWPVRLRPRPDRWPGYPGTGRAPRRRRLRCGHQSASGAGGPAQA